MFATVIYFFSSGGGPGVLLRSMIAVMHVLLSFFDLSLLLLNVLMIMAVSVTTVHGEHPENHHSHHYYDHQACYNFAFLIIHFLTPCRIVLQWTGQTGGLSYSLKNKEITKNI